MSIYGVKIQMHCPSTISKGWHKRRLKKMIGGIFHCCAYADPGEICDLWVDTMLQQNIDIDTYTIVLTIDLPEHKMNDFIRYARSVHYFHSVLPLDTTQPSDTIPPCQEETEQHHRQPATLLT